ncbi:hypothetical protein [Streptomyces sp. NPDC058657]|uniref:hypothetical protein n=1 Tax=unclassified Streptomyces TaxID=2593676 RepID=UPI00364D10D2
MRRQRVAVGAGAVALCLGGLLTVLGDGGGEQGFVAVGAAGAGPGSAPTKAVPPEGGVEFVPLDAPGRAAETFNPPPAAPGSAAHRTRPATTPLATTPRATTPPATTPRAGGRPAPPPTSSKPAPGPGPAELTVGSPVRAKADRRWCEKVTVGLRNSGGTAVRSGTLTFATHIIGALGVDWGTRTSSQPLPGPIGPGAARSATYTVCVDAWRVPLGMHVETRRVTAAWK